MLVLKAQKSNLHANLYEQSIDLFEDNTVINQIMGNTSALPHQSHHPQTPTQASSDFTLTDSSFSNFSIYSDPHNHLFIGRQIDLPQNYGRELILSNMQTTQTQTGILPIHHFQFHSVSTVCSQQEKCLLLSKKPEQTLQQMYNARKTNQQSFRASEITSIIARIASALQSQQKKQINLQLDMESIVFLQGKAYIVNSLMYDCDKDCEQTLGKFRAPETISGRYDLQQQNAWLRCLLFALGVIGLSLAFIQMNIQALIYFKTDKASRKNISQVEISHLLERIKNRNLASQLRALLSFNPKNREGIYDLIMNKENKQQLENTPARQNSCETNRSRFCSEERVQEIAVTSMNRPTPGPFRQSNITVRNHNITSPNVRVFAQRSTNLMQTHPQNAQKNQPYAIIITPENSRMSHIQANKQNIYSNSLQKGELKPQINRKNDSSCLEIVTPQKQRKNKQFSTIKEVTQYDDCNSVSCHKSIDFLSGKFEGNLVSGKKEGYGVFYFEQGSRYEGQWLNDRMHGFGKLYYYGDKLAYQGNWSEGEFHGNGKVYNSEPLELRSGFDFDNFGGLSEEWVSYQGQLEHDKRQGWGILRLSNGQRFEGEFKDDMVDGRGTFYSIKSGQIRGIWSESKLLRKEES